MIYEYWWDLVFFYFTFFCDQVILMLLTYGNIWDIWKDMRTDLQLKYVLAALVSLFVICVQYFRFFGIPCPPCQYFLRSLAVTQYNILLYYVSLAVRSIISLVEPCSFYQQGWWQDVFSCHRIFGPQNRFFSTFE